MTDLLALAERVEAATGAFDDLNAEVGQACGKEMRYEHPGSESPSHRPYCTSLDAAMTLKSEGVLLYSLAEKAPGRWQASLYILATDQMFVAEAGTPALALTAACLRARAASCDRSGEADETPLGGSAEGESAVPAQQGDAQALSPNSSRDPQP